MKATSTKVKFLLCELVFFFLVYRVQNLSVIVFITFDGIFVVFRKVKYLWEKMLMFPSQMEGRRQRGCGVALVPIHTVIESF